LDGRRSGLGRMLVLYSSDRLDGQTHTLNTQVSRERRLGHVDVFDLDLNLVHLTVRLLGSLEFTARSEERGCGIG
jgi:hypothetical protein